MAYNSAHTGPEIDAAVEMLSQVQNARDATKSDLIEVRALASEVDDNAIQVAEQAAAVATKSEQVSSKATAVELAHAEVMTASASAVEAMDESALSASSALASKETSSASEFAASQSRLAAGLSEQLSAENAASTSADRQDVSEKAQQVALDSASAAASAQSAAAVVTGGTATFASEPGKIPLANGQGKIDTEWLGDDVARTADVQAATDLAIDGLKAEISLEPTPDKIPRAGSDGTIQLDWMPSDVARTENLQIVETATAKLSRDSFPTLSDVLRKLHSGQNVTILCRGDSLTYSQDTTATGVDTQINGATQKRSTAPYPEKLAESLGLLGFAGNVTVINQGFPGDSSSRGLTRWAASPTADLVIIMYGTNDANNYGNLGVVSIPQFRANICEMIDIERAKGAAVILMMPPPVKNANDMNIRPYADQMSQIGGLYGVPVVDCTEQLASLSYIWTDGVHLTANAYREMGWNLASLFARRDGAARHVAAGDLILAPENIGFGGSLFTWTVGSESRTVIQLDPGQTLAVGVYCESRLQPIIHSVNGTSKTTTLTAYYSAGLLGTARLDHNPANGVEQMLFATPISRGYRVLYIRNDGADVTYVKGVEFASLASPAQSGRNSKKALGLCGAHIPMRNAVAAGANGWLALISYENRITLLGGMIFKVRIPSTTGSPGVAIVSTRNSSAFPSNNCLMAIRSGVNLIFRQYISSSSVTDVTVAGFFTSGADWAGELEIELGVGIAKLYANGVVVATMNSSVVLAGWGGLVCTGAVQTPSCDSAFIYGYDKEPI